MGEAAESVVTGEVTQAVRATNSDAGPIDEGDWIGIVRGAKSSVKGIVAVSGSLDGATVALLDHLVGPRAEIVTVVEGADATVGHTDLIHAWLDEHRPGVQVEVHRGAQPLYPYLFGVE
jgi:dihydroxyacetone kinase-like predicted kinase